MMLSVLLILSQSATAPVPVAVLSPNSEVVSSELAAEPIYGDRAVPDHVLASQRGGFRLPNGIDVALTVQTQTVVDGAVVLQTVFALDQGPASFAVHVPRDGSAVVAIARDGAARQTSTMPTVTYDSRSGVSVSPGFSTVPVSIGPDGPPGGGMAEGLNRIAATRGASTPNGMVSERTSGLLRIATLSSPDFSVAHFAGSAFGSAIANAGDGRSFDTFTSASIDLRDAGPDVLGSAMFRVENVALAALGSRM